MRWPVRTIAERFWSHASPEPNTGCWFWDGALYPNGYPAFAPVGTKVVPAHRFAFFLKHGRWPKPGYDACHTCDQPTCINPDHGFEGTRKMNMEDASRKGRTTVGEKSASAKLTWEKVRAIRVELAQGKSGAELAREHHVSPMTISWIRQGKRWPPEKDPSNTNPKKGPVGRRSWADVS